MPKKIIEDVAQGIKRVTTLDERWYIKSTDNKITGLPEYQFAPSLTWIADHYPKGIWYYKWLADKGWDEAESIKTAGGTRGSKVHQAIEVLCTGKEVSINDKFVNPETNQPEELSIEEYEALMSWCKWYGDNGNPKTIATEISVVAEVDGITFGCTIDWIGIINHVITICDWKTGQSLWPSATIQISAISQTIPFWPAEILEKLETLGFAPTLEIINLNVVQIGYRKNKAGYKENPMTAQFDLFKHAYAIWKNENPDAKPKQRDYPLILKVDADNNTTTVKIDKGSIKDKGDESGDVGAGLQPSKTTNKKITKI